MRHGALTVAFLGSILAALALPCAAVSDAAPSETTRCCVILQYRQSPGGKSFHLLITGSKGGYRLYQSGGYGLARMTGGSQPEAEMGRFQADDAVGVWHAIVFEAFDGKIRVFFDGKIAMTAEDRAPLPLGAAEMKIFVPGGLPGDKAADPEYQILFYPIGAPAAILPGAAGAGGVRPMQGDPDLIYSQDFEKVQAQLPDKWRIVTDEMTGSHVLTTAAPGNEDAYLPSNLACGDFVWDLQVRLVNSIANLYFRTSPGDEAYALRLERNRLVLWRSHGNSAKDLAAAAFAPGTTWHDYRISAAGRKIVVEVDPKDRPVILDNAPGAEKRAAIIFTDGAAALLSGGMGLEAFGGDGARFDNIKVHRVGSGDPGH